jgi:hypothetical protein
MSTIGQPGRKPAGHSAPRGERRILRRFFEGFATLAACLASITFLLVPSVVTASEGGTGHYVPGAVATMIDLAPTQPGWVIEPIYLRYEGDADLSEAIPLAGIDVFGVRATSDALILGGFYTFEQPLLGAHYSVGAMLPYVWMSVEGEIETAIGDRRRQDTVSGLGDVTLIPALLGWKQGPWQYNAALTVYAPTGDYEVGRLANPGLNYWSFNPWAGVSYNNPTNGFNAALHGGLVFNAENPDTDYRSGVMTHLEGSVQQLLPVGRGYLSLGAEAFWLEQVTADSGQRPILGDFKGRTAGIGPVLGYVLPMGEQNLVAELRWLPELETKNRLQGDYVWLKIVYQF